MSDHNDRDALERVTGLMDYLAELTDTANRDPIRDILEDVRQDPEHVIWLSELPEGVEYRTGDGPGPILRLTPPRSPVEPKVPNSLEEWVDSVELRGPRGAQPALLDYGPKSAEPDDRYEPPRSIRRAFDSWAATWRNWVDAHARVEARRYLYERLENLAKLMDQHDDEYELVIGTGLLDWRAPDGDGLRRHLVAQPASIQVDGDNAEIRVSLSQGKRRFEDRELLGEQSGYRPERAKAERAQVLDPSHGFADPQLLAGVKRWLDVGLEVPVTEYSRRSEAGEPLPDDPRLSSSPALILRSRSRVLLSEAYRRIAEELRKPDSHVPVALAQLVVETEPEQRGRWLRSQNAPTMDVLGEDPLFPLPTNEEQRQVMRLLGKETCVVVQGPPGTGKTHTIANLMSSFLSNGLRVLVTSQKDQALRVLRDKIPLELRRLCVLLAGGNRDAGTELERGLDALSAAMATPDRGEISGRIDRLADERRQLIRTIDGLDAAIIDLRQSESVKHPPVVPGYSRVRYHGIPADIVREISDRAAEFEWFPPVPEDADDLPALSAAELLELLGLLRTDSPQRRRRAGRTMPEAERIPTEAAVSAAIRAERTAKRKTSVSIAEAKQYEKLGDGDLEEIAQHRAAVVSLLTSLGFAGDAKIMASGNWVGMAIKDVLGSHGSGPWRQIHRLNGRAAKSQSTLLRRDSDFVIELPMVSELGLGPARGLLRAGRHWLDELEAGGKARKRWFQSTAQQQAADLVDRIAVNGGAPTEPAALAAALDEFEVHVDAAQLAEKWAEAGVTVTAEPLSKTLSELVANDQLLERVVKIAELRDSTQRRLDAVGVSGDTSSVEELLKLFNLLGSVLGHRNYERESRRVEALSGHLGEVVERSGACGELELLISAIGDRDLAAYRDGLAALDAARREQQAEHRRTELSERLRSAHPLLLDLMQRTVSDSRWDDRLAGLPDAWAWSKAKRFIERNRSVAKEHGLVGKREQLELRLRKITEELASDKAMWATLENMSESNIRALRSYRTHMKNVGAGTGKRASLYRRAAREAMEQARDAVPAWVVPLPNLLENIEAVRNSFDVVIVDEASQVGLEQLFLLWLAPRIIVVGDDKQCTPGESRLGRGEGVFAKLGDHLAATDHSTRMLYTQKANLYEVLSARSGRDSVVRLREHFRCMPEIINWSSHQFYGEEQGLIPLRERTLNDLEPLQVVTLTGTKVDAAGMAKRNRREAEEIIAQLRKCMDDHRYDGKTFGVIVLRGNGQIRLLENEILRSFEPEERVRRKLRVGKPPDFQGDERDVVFLSMVDNQATRKRSGIADQQRYNVAASRAKDQLWLFVSIPPEDLSPDDLRRSLLDYMLKPPSALGYSPDLDSVSETEHCEPFESLLEQRVFRTIAKRGYRVVPQHQVGRRRLDLVVHGAGGRIAVECDGDHWHASPQQRHSDLKRDRELRRMGWEVVRIRQSEFEFDPEREMAPLWRSLAQRGITPGPVATEKKQQWQPIDLPDELEEGTNR